MNVEGLYPDPPHLTLGVWNPTPEATTFAAVCRAVEAVGGSPTNYAYTVPADTQFDWHADLWASYPGPSEVGDRFGPLVRGDDPHLSVIQAGYFWGEDLVVVEQAPGPRDEVHPVRATMYGDVFFIPTDLWTVEEQERAAILSASVVSLFRTIVAETTALYGLIQLEDELPTPSRLLTSGLISDDLFLSNTLLDDDPHLVADLQGIRPLEAVEWPTGLFFPTYGPFRTDGTTQWIDHELDRARALRLGESVNRYLAKRSS